MWLPTRAGWIEAGALLAATAVLARETGRAPPCDLLPRAEAARRAREAAWREAGEPAPSGWCRRVEEPMADHGGTTREDCPVAVGGVTLRRVSTAYRSRYSGSNSVVLALDGPGYPWGDGAWERTLCTLRVSESGGGSVSGALRYATLADGVVLLRCVEHSRDSGMDRGSTERVLALRPRRPSLAWRAALALGWGALAVAVALLRRGVARDRWREVRRGDGGWRLGDGRAVRVEGVAEEEAFVLLDEGGAVPPYREGALVPARVVTRAALAEERRAAREHGFWRVVHAACVAVLAALAAWSLR